MSLKDCVNECVPHNHTGNYSCDWSIPNQPQCIQGKGKLEKQDCERNCKEPSFSKCNYETGVCEACNITDPNCKYTKDECDVFCHTSSSIGVFRGIQINKNFDRGEWDFTFNKDGSVAFQPVGTTNEKYEATTSNDGQASEGTSIVFRITKAPTSGPLNINAGDVLSGLFVNNPGQNQIINFMYLGFGTNTVPAETFDEAMIAFEFVLNSCQSSSTSCNFQANEVPM